MKSFSDWLEENESLDEVRRLSARPEDLSKADFVRDIIQVGDIVQLGKETQHKGESVPKYGKVVEVGAAKVVISPFMGNNPILVNSNELYHVDPDDEIMPAGEQQAILKDLGRLGGKNLWIKMTVRQKNLHEREKRKKQKDRETRTAALAMPDTQKVDRSEIDRIKALLFGGGPSSAAPSMPAVHGAQATGSQDFNRLFGDAPKRQGAGPLAGRVRRGSGSVADRFAAI